MAPNQAATAASQAIAWQEVLETPARKMDETRENLTQLRMALDTPKEQLRGATKLKNDGFGNMVKAGESKKKY